MRLFTDLFTVIIEYYIVHILNEIDEIIILL